MGPGSTSEQGAGKDRGSWCVHIYRELAPIYVMAYRGERVLSRQPRALRCHQSTRLCMISL